MKKCIQTILQMCTHDNRNTINRPLALRFVLGFKLKQVFSSLQNSGHLTQYGEERL
jgi:hypothetical protein